SWRLPNLEGWRLLLDLPSNLSMNFLIMEIR
ncbi:MAG: hypothetical protein ACI9M6_000937, partial [Hydrogenophaga sp.]